jgi:hypothetical protein
VRADVAIRRALLRSSSSSAKLRVIAIAHDTRKPGYWLKRLDR